MHLLVKSLLAAGVLAVAAMPALASVAQASSYYEDALQRYEQKDLPGAIIQLRNALQADRSMLAAHVLMGKALLGSGDPAGAEQRFDEALRLGVNPAEVITLLGQAYIMQGKHETLLQRVTTSGLPRAQQVGVLVLRANAQAERQNIPAALASLDEARALDPDSVAVRLAQATLRQARGESALAARLVDEALLLAPEDATVWNMRGSVQQSTGDLQGAMASYAKALALAPDYLEPRVTRAGLLIDLGRVDEAERELAEIARLTQLEPRVSYMRALIATRRGDRIATKAALEEAIQLLDALPAAVLANNKQMLLLSALAHYNLGNRETASDRLNTHLRRYPGDAAGAKLLARLHLDMGRHASAAALLEPLRRRSPDDPRVLSLLAATYMQQGNYSAAVELLDQAVRTSDGAADILAELGIGLAASGRIDEAVAQLRQAWEQDRKQTRTGMVLATLYLRAGQSAQALELLDVVARNEPSNLSVLNMLGVARVAAGDPAGGRRAYEQVLAQSPANQVAILNLSALDMSEGKPDAARQRLLELLRRDEGHVQAMMEMATLEERVNRPAEAVRWLDKARGNPDAAVSAGLRLAELHLRTGAGDKALTVAREVLLRAPQNLAALGLVVRAQLSMGDRDGARQTLADMARRAADDPAANFELARLQLAAGNAADALVSLDKVLAVQPDFVPALILSAEVEIRRREFGAAEQRIRRLAEAPRGVALRLQGDLAMARGQHAAAVTAYGNALARDDTADVAVRLFRAHAAAGGLARGAEFLRAWLKNHPDNTVALRSMGDAELQLGNLAAARAAYERILALRPDEAMVWNNLAHVAAAQNDDAATAFAERAHALRPADAAVIDTYGWLLFRQGQVERGLALLREARLRNSTNPEIRYHLAAALARSGRTAEAREELAQAFRMSATFPDIEAARALQAELEKQAAGR